MSSITSQYLVIEKELLFVKKLLQRQDATEIIYDEKADATAGNSSNINFYISELENSTSLVQLLTKEIDTLQNSMAAILDEGAAKIAHEKLNATDNQAIHLLQRQVRELRAVWTREVAANTFLRTLISKTQAERLKSEESVQLRWSALQEEFDELAELFDGSRKEIELLKTEKRRSDRILLATEGNQIESLEDLRNEYKILTEKYLKLQSDYSARDRAFEQAKVKYEDLEQIKSNQNLSISSARIFELYNIESNDSAENSVLWVDNLIARYGDLKKAFDSNNTLLENVQNKYNMAVKEMDNLRSSQAQNEGSSSRIIEFQNLLQTKEVDRLLEKENITKQLLETQNKYSSAMEELETLRKSLLQIDKSPSQIKDLERTLKVKEEEWLSEREKILQQLLLAGEEINQLTQVVSENQEEIKKLRSNKGEQWSFERKDMLERLEQKTQELSVYFTFYILGIKY